MLLRYLSGNGSKGSAEHGCCELCSRPTSTWKSISSWHPRPPDGKTPKKTIRIIVNINPQNGRIVKKKELCGKIANPSCLDRSTNKHSRAHFAPVPVVPTWWSGKLLLCQIPCWVNTQIVYSALRCLAPGVWAVLGSEPLPGASGSSRNASGWCVHLIWVQGPCLLSSANCPRRCCVPLEVLFSGKTADGRLKFQLSLELNETENTNIFQDTQSYAELRITQSWGRGPSWPHLTGASTSRQGSASNAFRVSQLKAPASLSRCERPSPKPKPWTLSLRQVAKWLKWSYKWQASKQRDRNSEPLGCQGEIHSNLGY